MPILHQCDYQRVRWKNDGGWTTQLAVCPASSKEAGVAFDWRISIAEIETDGAFSVFPGCDRHIALLDGIGMHLSFDKAPDVELNERLRFVHFDGEWRTHGRLQSGPVRDFNVISRRDAVTVQVLHRPLVGPMVFLPEANVTWFVYVAGGHAELMNGDASSDLRTADSVLLEAHESGGNVVLDGGGEVVLVKLLRHSSTDCA
ncbi:MAG: HutD family protein [Rudaea sp.]